MVEANTPFPPPPPKKREKRKGKLLSRVLAPLGGRDTPRRKILLFSSGVAHIHLFFSFLKKLTFFHLYFFPF